MAAQRSAAQKGELAVFVQHLYAESGAVTWKEFADRARVHWTSLSDWQTGKSVPDGWNLYQLIRAAAGDGELSAAARAALELARAPVPQGEGEELHRRLGELVSRLEELDDLRGARGE